MHQFEVGKSYLIFAARLDKPDGGFGVPTNAAIPATGEFRQLYHGGVLRTLDDRQINAPVAKDAYWLEVSLMLGDSDPANQLYAIEKLDSLSLAGRRDDEWTRSGDFKRNAVLDVLLPLITESNGTVAIRAMNCFATESNAAIRLAPYAKSIGGPPMKAIHPSAGWPPSARCLVFRAGRFPIRWRDCSRTWTRQSAWAPSVCSRVFRMHLRNNVCASAPEIHPRKCVQSSRM